MHMEHMKGAGNTSERGPVQKGLRLSRGAFPVGSIFAALVVAVLWGLHRVGWVPAWVAYVVGLFAVFGAMGDALNIVYSRRRLRRLEEETRRREAR
jgi:hypothetical protein